MHATHYAYRYRISCVKKVRGTCVKGPCSDFESFNFEYHARDYVANRIASVSIFCSSYTILYHSSLPFRSSLYLDIHLFYFERAERITIKNKLNNS